MAPSPQPARCRANARPAQKARPSPGKDQPPDRKPEKVVAGIRKPCAELAAPVTDLILVAGGAPGGIGQGMTQQGQQPEAQQRRATTSATSWAKRDRPLGGALARSALSVLSEYVIDLAEFCGKLTPSSPINGPCGRHTKSGVPGASEAPAAAAQPSEDRRSLMTVLPSSSISMNPRSSRSFMTRLTISREAPIILATS